MTLDESAVQEARRALYAGPRATFVERRKVLAAAARDDGDRDLAKEIEAIRKPSAAAHLVNLLAHAEDEQLIELVELGASIRAAMGQSDDAEMRSLLQRRPAAIANTVARAKELARSHGESVSGAVVDQIAQTLRAAMGSEEAADAVRAGTLADVLDEPGFGGVSIGTAERAPSPKRTTKRTTASSADVAGNAAADEAARVAAAERVAAEDRVRSAVAAVTRAERALATTTKKRDLVTERRDKVAAQLAEIEEELAAAQADVEEGEARLRDAAAEEESARAGVG